MSRWIEPSAIWFLAPVGVLLIGYTAANAAGVIPAAVIVALIAGTLSFIHPQRWVVWGVLAALSVPTGLASAAMAGVAAASLPQVAGLTMISALLPAFFGAAAGCWLRTKVEPQA